MCKNCKNSGVLDTSAQLGKTPINDYELSANVADNKNLAKVAKRKFLTSNLSLRLLYFSEAKREIESDDVDFEQEQKIIKSYRNMFYCNSEMILQPDGTLKTRYCKNRLCLICNANKTASLIDKYECVFNEWEQDMYMVTLTISNVTNDILKDSIMYMNKTFNKIKDVFKKKYQKNDIEKFEGIKKLECTSNRENDFHPHFHILVRGEQNALKLKDLWIDYINKGKHQIIDSKTGEVKKIIKFFAGESGQDVRKADNNSIKELFKYFTKIISKTATDRAVYIDRIDTIFRSIRGCRIFQSFGFKLSDYGYKKPEKKINEIELEQEIIFYENIDSEQLEINKKIRNFDVNSSPNRALDLIADFAIMEIEKKTLFNKYLTENQLNELKKIVIENSSDCLSFLEKKELFYVENQPIVKKYELADYEIFIPDAQQDKRYFFDYRIGNWIELEKSFRINDIQLKNYNKLFNFNISTALQDIVQSFVYPAKYRAKIFELYEWKNSIKNLYLT